MDYEKSNYLPEYNGSDTIATNPKSKYLSIVYVLLTIVYGIDTVFLDKAIFGRPSIILDIGFALTLGSLIIYLVKVFSPSGEITISSDGVEYESKDDDECKKFMWEDIKSVGIATPSSIRFPLKRYMYFAAKDEDPATVLDGYFSKPLVIKVKYQHRIVHCTLKYWNKEIKNLDAMKSWKRYINRL